MKIPSIRNRKDLAKLTQEQARAWLIANDLPSAVSFWESLPDGTDFIANVRQNIRDYGYER